MNNVNLVASTSAGASSAVAKPNASQNSLEDAPSFADILETTEETPTVSTELQSQTGKNAATSQHTVPGNELTSILMALAANDSLPAEEQGADEKSADADETIVQMASELTAIPATLSEPMNPQAATTLNPSALAVTTSTNGQPENTPSSSAPQANQTAQPESAPTASAPQANQTAQPENTPTASAPQANQTAQPESAPTASAPQANQSQSQNPENPQPASETTPDASGSASQRDSKGAPASEHQITKPSEAVIPQSDPATAKNEAAPQVNQQAAQKNTAAPTAQSASTVADPTMAELKLAAGKNEMSPRIENPTAPNKMDTPSATSDARNDTVATSTTSTTATAKSGQTDTRSAQAGEPTIKASNEAPAAAQNTAKTADILPPSLNITPTGEIARPAGIMGQTAMAGTPGQASLPQVSVNNIAVHIAAQARAGNQRFDIRLDPPELGRIDIRLEIGRDGQTLTHLAVEKPETLDLLRQDSRQLERALNNAGLDSRDGSLSFSLREDNRNKQQTANSEQEGTPASNDNAADENEQEDAAAERTLNISSGLDISI